MAYKKIGENILTTLERVRWCYDNYQDAVETDSCLIVIYENYFGKLKQNQISTVKRCGRHLRATNHNYNRSKIKIQQDKTRTQIIKEVFENAI